ncbi:hypothetical protein ACO0LD_31150 [Undibacterium sp. Ji83W]|uniref:hypothetical protein n=1 Tax=Undibacterium sp. Ji83W TaxID=3413043 RepID=UPI003BEF850C
MSELTATARPKITRRYIHAEDATHTNLLVASIVCLLMTAGFSWGASRQCGSACVSGEYLLIFSPVASIMLVAHACWRIYLRKRLGRLVLQLPVPLHPGCRDVPAALTFTGGLGQGMRQPAADYPLTLEVACIHVTNSAEENSTSTLWSKELKRRRIAHGAGRVDFTLSLPAELPRSGPLGRSEFKIIWKLQLKMLGTKVSFVLPVKLLATN